MIQHKVHDSGIQDSMQVYRVSKYKSGRSAVSVHIQDNDC